jgi:hypothetical protein
MGQVNGPGGPGAGYAPEDFDIESGDGKGRQDVSDLAESNRAEMLAMQFEMMQIQHQSKMDEIITTAAVNLQDQAGKTASKITDKIGQ